MLSWTRRAAGSTARSLPASSMRTCCSALRRYTPGSAVGSSWNARRNSTRLSNGSIFITERTSRSEDHVRRLFRNHVDGADDEKPRNAREYRRVDDAQPLGAVHPEVAIDYAAAVARPNRAAAGRMVAPGSGAHIILQLVVALARLARLFLFGDRIFGSEPCRQFAHKPDAGDDRVEVRARLVAALLEIMEVDQRGVARVCAAQHDFAGAVFGMRLQDRPGQIIGLGDGERGITGEIPAEQTNQGKAEQVRERAPGV